MDNEAIRQAMDASRPDDCGLDAHELAELEASLAADESLRTQWERSHRLDARITEAFQQVDVPQGLEERLLNAVDEATPTVQTPSRPNSRRLLLGLTASLACILLVGFFIVRSRKSPLEISHLTDVAQRVMQQTDSKWQASTPPAGHGLPGDVIPQGALRWKRISTDRFSGVAYDLTAAGDGSVVLLVLPTKKELHLSEMPFQPLEGTGGLSMGAWRKADTIYVIVGRQGKRRLWYYVSRPNIT